jgi:toxin ParE1/3/4
MPTVHKLPKANDDLFAIWGFIAADNIAAADAWIDKLDAQFLLLASHPFMGRERRELAKDLRSFPFGRYVIFYLPATNGINVVRVLHSARDIETSIDFH